MIPAAFGCEFVMEGFQVAIVHEAEVIRAPFIVARKIVEGFDRAGGARVLAGALAANDQSGAADCEKNLRRATGDGVSFDVSAEHLDVPGGAFGWIFSDDVDVVEAQGGIAHVGGSRVTVLEGGVRLGRNCDLL